MPIPKPKKGQDEQEFMSRCMGDEMMKKDFPDQKQRVAVCLTQVRRKKATGSELDWEDCADEPYTIY
jgi:hypothetical protein